MLVFPRLARWAAGFALAWLAVASAATAQEAAAPRSWNDLDKEIKSRKIRIDDMLAGNAGFVEQDFDAFYDLVFERFTHPQGGPHISKMREALKKNFQAAGKGSQAAHARLTALMLQRMPALYEEAPQDPDDQHALLVRVNAMLVIAELNSDEVQGTQVATPLPEALPLLIAGFNNANYPAPVRIAAQVGLLRHAESGIADQNRIGQVQDATLAMLATKQPPAGWSDDALLWARLRACDILGAIGLPGAGDGPAAVVTGLGAVVQDQAALLLLRSAAAKGLGQLDYQSAGAVNYSRLAQLLAGLSVEVVRKANSVSALQEKFLPIESALIGPPKGPAGAAEAESTAGTIHSWAAATPHKEYVDLLAAQFEPLRQAVRDKNVTLKLANSAADTFDGWLNSNPPATGDVVATN